MFSDLPLLEEHSSQKTIAFVPIRTVINKFVVHVI
jgi:hypothetical protein